ncbi:hypothetical protein P691DRAFT_657228 [Macrolepiota fuliginosa MF-IS2]|uniref:Zn(2)-C6 fungal-type domain-containing protein n=1 Tax=Macrolepiota fuliginosa MF-IS2 TaxID=1400762 RepID=A0A9P5XQN8_9AGAR|nr:hypothetical protein P691DRAFT_657228 [Macrolepiota fuliginosa MF-IS2]
MQPDDEPGSSPTQTQEHQVKRRRLHGACDTCRRKKSDSAEMPNKICSNCIAYNLECTHDVPRHASKKETEKGYIQALEERLDKMEQLLRQVRPELDPEQPVPAVNSPESAHSVPTPSRSHNTPVADLPYPTPQTLPDSAAFHSSPAAATNDSSDEEDLAHISLSKHLNHLAIDGLGDRFFGKSSAFMFVRHATNVKQEITGVEIPRGRYLRRPLFWYLRSWEFEYVNSDHPKFVFPETDLLGELVALYFERFDVHVPLLHRPTFERDLANDLHLHDTGFGQVVLMVCALASRSTDNPRVMLPGDKTCLSSGFKYFSQTQLLRNKLLEKPSLYDLQYYCLVIPYLMASLPQAAWNLVGFALRIAQERGAHRRRGEGYKPTVVDELWKRCFWCLVSYDRLSSSVVGRPSAMQDEDFDADLLIECDDEYWECEDPAQNWKQPLGKPSKVTAFNLFLRLCEILAFTLRTLYSIKKSKVLTGLIGDEWEQRVVTELDSSMNLWKDTLPDHLRWDPNQRNVTFLHQSAMLHATFYYLQIQIHRPFIQKSTPLSFPSLAICTNAARACSHLVDAKGPGWIYPHPIVFISAFASGIVLLLHTYSGRRAGLNTDREKEMKDVQRCIDSLQATEKQWHIAGRFFDILSDIATMHEGQLPEAKSVSNKRPRDDTVEHEQPSNSGLSPPQLVKPIRQPKGWPPTSPTPGYQPAATSNTDHLTFLSSDLDTIPHNPTASMPPTSLSSYQLSESRFPQLDPSPTGSGWGLSDLLLAQMNFGAAPLSGGPLGHPSHLAATPSNNHDGTTNTPGAVSGQIPVSPISTQNQVFDMNQDMTLWSDAPSNFNIEEWDRFVASLNGSGGLWIGANVNG